MSGTPDPTARPERGAAPAEPSMEDILASIRRILNEDEGAAGVAQPKAAAPQRPEDVLVLDTSMMVGEPEAAPAEAPAAEMAEMEPAAASPPLAARPAAAPPAAAEEEETAGVDAAAGDGRLMAPEVEAAAAAAATAAVGSLVRRLAVERGALVHRGGPTIEDLVREEVRPLLRAWLDANLPGLVERLVRAEIERVLGRIAP
jgi:uncharacterized protein